MHDTDIELMLPVTRREAIVLWDVLMDSFMETTSPARLSDVHLIMCRLRGYAESRWGMGWDEI